MRARQRIMGEVLPHCGCTLLFMLLALAFCFVISLAGCSSGKVITERVEVPVVVTQEHHTESVKIDYIRDTLVQRDSVYYYIKGDTTLIERWHYLQGTTNVVRVDTLIKVDSVQVPVVTEKIVTQTKEVEKPLHWWQKLLMWLGGIVLCGGSVWLLMKIRGMTRL